MTQPEEEPPGIWQYIGRIGPSLTETLVAVVWEGFTHSPERDQVFMELLESERVLRNPDWVITRARAYDPWNVERDLLNP